MNLENFNAGEFLKRDKGHYNPNYDAHPLKEFFASRGISMPKLARLLDVNQMTVYTWFRGQKPIPPVREQQLNQIKAKILDFESNGKRSTK
jgi:hypothetical protein